MTNRLLKFFLIAFLPWLMLSCNEETNTNKASKTSDTSISTTKQTYLNDEQITINYKNMSGHNNNWIAIFPAEASSTWGNQSQWSWTKGQQNGQKTFETLPLGNYEVRAFFDNSYEVEASYSFKVDGIYNPAQTTTLTLDKTTYAENELIYVNYHNMQGNETDWIGLYRADSGNDIENLIDSKQLRGRVNGEISLGGIDALADTLHETGGLKSGKYEVRAFFNGSLEQESIATFEVIEKEVSSTIYESADGEISPDWQHVSGPTAPFYENSMVNLSSNWINSTTNTSEYKLLFPQANTTQKVLELDAGGLRYQKHFFIGVILETTYGPRKMIWDPFFTHGNVKAFKKEQYLSYPLYTDIQLGSETKKHIRVDVEKYLRLLEPSNKVVNISAFMASGGDLDEIKLSSH
ncbi:MAG TPA: hypothetical protein ENK82_06500 [Campylobacterales bacterium]|nr:hypothetical protein [Campylobacterales bacterium]HHS92979.1 hypothetical protein [Campylobacterales bacterium]